MPLEDMRGDRVLIVSFEQPATDPGPWIGRILEYCGLTREPGCLNPHETDRIVTTACVSQGREKINTKGIGTALPYRE